MDATNKEQNEPPFWKDYEQHLASPQIIADYLGIELAEGEQHYLVLLYDGERDKLYTQVLPTWRKIPLYTQKGIIREVPLGRVVTAIREYPSIPLGDAVRQSEENPSVMELFRFLKWMKTPHK